MNQPQIQQTVTKNSNILFTLQKDDDLRIFISRYCLRHAINKSTQSGCINLQIIGNFQTHWNFFVKKIKNY